nr:ribonuclease H-like domain-containing protein [Tanacetum cinerariifolium]
MEGLLFFPQRLQMNTLLFRGNQRQELPYFSLFLMIMWLISIIWMMQGIYGMQSKLALTLKTKGGLKLLSFDDLYYKLKTLENKKLAYEEFEQIEKLDLEDMDLKWQMAMLSVRVHKFEQKTRRKIDFDKKESARYIVPTSRVVVPTGRYIAPAGLGFNNYIRKNELGWDDSAFSVFTTDSEDVEGRPLFNRAGKVNIPLARLQPVPTGGKVTFGGGEGRITGKGTIQTSTLDFENVYYVKELQQFDLFSISQICDKKNRVLFTNIECLVLSTDFKLPDESMVVLRVPRKHNLYTINLNNL